MKCWPIQAAHRSVRYAHYILPLLLSLQGLVAVGRLEEAVEMLERAMRQSSGSSAADIAVALRQAKAKRKQERAKEGQAYARALAGWATDSKRVQASSRLQEFDDGEFDERTWLMNSRAEKILDRIGGDSPFPGIRMNHES